MAHQHSDQIYSAPSSHRGGTGTLLVRGGHVLTMDPSIGDLDVGDVLIVDGRIAAVGENIDAEGAEVIDAAGAIVIPGLIDGHRHLWQTLLRGTAVDWSLAEYMVEVRAMYSGSFDEEAAYLSNYVGGLESLDAGITTVVDHSHLLSSPEMGDALVKGLADSGVGGVFCYAFQNVPDYRDGAVPETDAVRDLLLRLPDEWHDENFRRLRETYFGETDQRLQLGIALPETAPYLPLPVMRMLLTRIRDLDPFLLTGHWDAGTPEPVTEEISKAGEWLERTSLTHCNHLSDDALMSLVEQGVGVCTTPNTECGGGLGPLVAPRFVELGGAASIGTDLSSSGRADILYEARLVLQAERMERGRAAGRPPASIGWPARDALELATRIAAEALGLSAEVGTLTPGKRGDVVVVRPDPLVAGGDAAVSLLFYTSHGEVETVIIQGDIMKRGGVLVGVDLDDIRRSTEMTVTRVQSRYETLPRQALEKVWEGMF